MASLMTAETCAKLEPEEGEEQTNPVMILNQTTCLSLFNKVVEVTRVDGQQIVI